MLAARREQIAQGLANTEKINAALAAIDAQREDILTAAHGEAARFIDEGRHVATRMQQQAEQQASAAADRILVRAREQAASERALMLATARREIGRLVVDTTARVAGRVLTADDQRRLVQETTRQLNAA